MLIDQGWSVILCDSSFEAAQRYRDVTSRDWVEEQHTYSDRSRVGLSVGLKDVQINPVIFSNFSSTTHLAILM